MVSIGAAASERAEDIENPEIEFTLPATIKMGGRPLKANYFEFVCEPINNNVGGFTKTYALNDGRGMIYFRMKTPRNNLDIGKVVKFYVYQNKDSYKAGDIAHDCSTINPLPSTYRITYDTSKFTVAYEVVEGADGNAEYKVISYSRALSFMNNAR